MIQDLTQPNMKNETTHHLANRLPEILDLKTPNSL